MYEKERGVYTMAVMAITFNNAVKARWMIRVIPYGFYCNINVMKDEDVMHYTFT